MTKIELASEPKVELRNFMGGDDHVAMSAWVSFGNDRDDRLEDRVRVRGLIDFLYRNDHLTPFESSVFNFRVETPLFVAREFMRHRAASYNEWSGRYAELDPVFHMPDRTRPLVQQGKPGQYRFVAGTPTQYQIMYTEQLDIFERAYASYLRQLEAGIAKEVARNVIPLGLYTKFYATMNARNLMHFLELRTDETALHEIRQVAWEMEKHLEEKMPFTYESYKRKQLVQ